MAFMLDPNCVVDVWVNPAAPPWISGDPPDIPDLPFQKTKPWLGVSDVQAAGAFNDTIALVRGFVGPLPIFQAEWVFQAGGSVTYLRPQGTAVPVYWAYLASDLWFEANVVVGQNLWLTPVAAL